jgi:hypothetical protein
VVAGLDDLYRVIAAHGRGLDILVANAGGGSLATLEETAVIPAGRRQYVTVTVLAA